ncbi:MAG: glycosyltransferase family 39 protein [Phormidesmis sp.]
MSFKLGLRILAIAVIVWSCFIRFYDLGAKVYWEDETFTSLRVAGYTRQEFIEATFQGQVIYPPDLLQFQTINTEKGLPDTVASLADDVHPPGYFALLRLWAEQIGSSPAAMRSLSAVIGLLLLPCVYWLSMTLFHTWPHRQAVSTLAVIFVAVSPYHIEIATEARMYSLWLVTTTLAGVFLLRASRHNRRRDWALYSLAGMASLYVHWFSVLVLLGHGLYVLAVKGLGWTKMHQRYVWATVAMGAAVVPWIIFAGSRLTNIYNQTTWTAAPVETGRAFLLKRWRQNLTSLFVNDQGLPQSLLLEWTIDLLLIGLIVVSLVVVWRRTKMPVWAFVLIGSSIIFGPLAIADLVLGGRRSTILRYPAPSFVTIEMAVAFYLMSAASAVRPTSGQTGLSAKAIARSLASGCIAILIVAGIASQTIAAVTFDPAQQPLVKVATVLNDTPQARLVSDIRASQLLPLAHLLKADTQLQFLLRPQTPVIPIAKLKAEKLTVFTYAPSGKLKIALEEQGYKLSPMAGIEDMLRLDYET